MCPWKVAACKVLAIYYTAAVLFLLLLLLLCFTFSASAHFQAPIYEGLVAALAADLAVTRAALIAAYGSSNGDASNSASRGSHSTGASATYALVTHPGHHASRDSCAGYCVRETAPVLL